MEWAPPIKDTDSNTRKKRKSQVLPHQESILALQTWSQIRNKKNGKQKIPWLNRFHCFGPKMGKRQRDGKGAGLFRVPLRMSGWARHCVSKASRRWSFSRISCLAQQGSGAPAPKSQTTWSIPIHGIKEKRNENLQHLRDLFGPSHLVEILQQEEQLLVAGVALETRPLHRSLAGSAAGSAAGGAGGGGGGGGGQATDDIGAAQAALGNLKRSIHVIESARFGLGFGTSFGTSRNPGG